MSVRAITTTQNRTVYCVESFFINTKRPACGGQNFRSWHCATGESQLASVVGGRGVNAHALHPPMYTGVFGSFRYRIVL